MSTIQGHQNAVLYSSSGTLTAGENAKVYVYSQGCYVNGAQSITAAAGQTLTVRSVGSFAAGDYVKTGISGTVRQLSGASGTTLTFAAGTAITFTDAQHLLNIGTSSAGTSSNAAIYSVNDSAATAVTSSLITADANGNFQFFAAAGVYDLLIQNSGGTDLYILPEIVINLMSRDAATGVVYVSTATDDFAVGGSTTTAAMYVDESAETVYMGGQSGTYAALDGATPKLTVSGADPSVVLTDTDNSLSTTLKQSTATSSKTVTLPNITGTVIVDAGTQTLSGDKTLSGTTVISGTTTVSGAATFSNTVTVSGASITHNAASVVNAYFDRISGSQGTSLATTDFALGGSWGATAAVSAVTGTDTRFLVTVSGATGAGTTGATLVLTFKDGAWASAPFAAVSMSSTSSALGAIGAGLVPVTVTTSTTTLTITVNGAPQIGATYRFYGIVLG